MDFLDDVLIIAHVMVGDNVFNADHVVLML